MEQLVNTLFVINLSEYKSQLALRDDMIKMESQIFLPKFWK